jgi:hypothetical protein
MKKILLSFPLLLAFSLSFFNSCTYKSKEELLGSVVCDTSGVKYSSTIQPILTTYCNSQSGCHGANAGSISLVGYQNVFNNVDNVFSAIDNGSMPKGSTKLDACTINQFQNWLNQGAPNN